MGMGWHTISYPYESEDTKETRPCNCGKGEIITVMIVTEESDYPPFERGHYKTTTTCPNNCENIAI